MVGDNNTNQSFIGIYNDCLYMVLYLQDILVLVCGIWYYLAKNYIVIGSGPAP